MTRPVTLVACGLVVDRTRRRFLLGSRPQGKPYEGWWELPGGKLEAGESPLDCLKREFLEELGIRIGECAPWVCLENDYPHAYVRLHIYRIFSFEGELQAKEGQRFAWFEIGRIPDDILLLPRVAQTVRWLDLPEVLNEDGMDPGSPVVAGMHGVSVPGVADVRAAAEEGAQFALLPEPREISWQSQIPVYFPAREASELKRAQALGAHGIFVRRDL